MEVLSEHLCQGWLEGYLLTGRHGLFNCYEAFIHIVDSMFNQHAKWLKTDPAHPLAGTDRVAELPAVLPRLAPGQQRLLAPGPGLHRPRDQQEVRDRPRLPARRTANTLLSVTDHCLRSRNYVNLVIAGKQPAADLPDHGRGRSRTAPAASASGRGPATTDGDPDVVLACAGDIPTLETLAAADLLRTHLPELRVRVDQRRRPHASRTGHRAPARAVRP